MRTNIKIGEFFKLEDFTRSATATRLGIDNTPTEVHEKNLRKLAVEILDPLHHIIGNYTISSGYRSPKLNEAVKGVATSAHAQGQAVDIVYKDIRFVFEFIRDNFVYDQVILESLDGSNGKSFWVHVAYREGNNRGQSFTQHNHKRTSPITVNKKWN